VIREYGGAGYGCLSSDVVEHINEVVYVEVGEYWDAQVFNQLSLATHLWVGTINEYTAGEETASST